MQFSKKINHRAKRKGEKNERHTGGKGALTEKWQMLKMLIGVISKGEAAQEREGSKAADRQSCMRKAYACVTR